MKNLIQAAVVTLFAASTVQAQQAVQWKVSDGGNGHWYKLDGVLRSWEQARLIAVAAGGHLATIQSLAENGLVVSLSTTPPPGMNRSCWLGGRQLPGSCEPGCGWTWITGEPFDFQYWLPGEPNNVTVSEDYLHIWVTDQWNDTNASHTSESVIEWDADCNTDGIVDYGQCHDGTLPDYNGNNIPDCCERGEACVVGNYPVQWRVEDGGNGHWYQVVADKTSFDSHQSLAVARGGMVACMANAEENDFVYRLARARGLPAVWIGMVQDPAGSEPDGGWHWIDGSNSTWRNWGIGEPNNWQYDEDNCVMIVTPAPYDEPYWPSRWQDYPAFAQISAVTEWSADCNNDGIVDYGQILTGQLADLNGNGVPDICEGPTCRDADLFRNGVINGADLGILLSEWGPANANTVSDINHDGVVNGADLGFLLANWGPCPG